MSGVMEMYRRFFDRDDEAIEARRIERSRQVLEWASCAYFQEFMNWLDEMASAPVEVTSDHMKMVQAAVQSNTHRQIRKHLIRLVDEAKRLNEETRGSDA